MSARTCPTCRRPKAAVYARISDDQKGERLGVGDQIEDCWAKATEEGWCTCSPESDTFSDNDIGAFRRKPRPGYEAMKEAIGAGSYGVLLARDDSRLTRNVRDAFDLVELVDQRRVKVVLLWTQHWELSNAAGRKRVRDSFSDAQYEADRTGERVARARLRGAKQGLPSPGGQRAWGFQKDRITHDPEEAEQVRDVARRVLAGESLRSASLRHGKAAKDVRRALLNPRMIGKRAYHSNEARKDAECTGELHCPGCLITDAAWEPILDRDTWEGVRAILTTRNRDRVAGVVARKYLLTGLVFCGACGDRCQGFRVTRTLAGGRRAEYLRYVCGLRGCVVRSAPKLEAYVRDELLRRAEVTITPATVDPALTGAVTGYEARLTEIQEAMAEPGAPVSALSRAYQETEAKLQEARARVATATEEWELTGYWAEDPETGEPLWSLTGEEAEKRLWWDDADLRQQRVLLARHVSRIVLHPNQRRRVFDPRSTEILGKDGQPWEPGPNT